MTVKWIHFIRKFLTPNWWNSALHNKGFTFHPRHLLYWGLFLLRVTLIFEIKFCTVPCGAWRFISMTLGASSIIHARAGSPPYDRNLFQSTPRRERSLLVAWWTRTSSSSVPSVSSISISNVTQKGPNRHGRRGAPAAPCYVWSHFYYSITLY